jgi:hypothetical protein
VSYRIEAIESSRSPDFGEAYGALAAEFAPRGELERREVVVRWLDEAVPVGGERLTRSYHLLVARDAGGAFAGVRDCHVVLDRKEGVAVVYLAHTLVLAPYRRSGLGALFRSAPIGIARRVLGEAGEDPQAVDLLLAAEMEPASLEDEASLVRLTAYGKDGFAAISPAVLPYCQPDFRGIVDTLDEPRPIPLLAVVRFLDHEGAASLPSRLARAFVTHLHAVFATHVPAEHLADLEARTLGVLDAVPTAEVPLLRLPRTLDDHEAVLSLTRAAVLPFFPAELR